MTEQIKTYGVTVDHKYVGYVDAGSELVYNDAGDTVIGRLTGSKYDWTFVADQDWHRKDLNGKKALVDPAPTHR